jgi:hypothetical protein
MLKSLFYEYILGPYEILENWIHKFVKNYFNIYLFSPFVYAILGCFSGIYASLYTQAAQEPETIWQWSIYLSATSFFLSLIMFSEIRLKLPILMKIIPTFWIILFLSEYSWCIFLWISYYNNPLVIIKYTTMYPNLWSLFNIIFWVQTILTILIPFIFFILFLSALYFQLNKETEAKSNNSQV